MKAAKQMHPLPWWGVLCVIVGALPIFFLFNHFGRFELARPILYDTAILCFAVALLWKLRRHVWFWITITALIALHLALILSVRWTTKWVPAMAVVPIGLADLYVVLVIVSVVGRVIEKAETSNKG
jgi:hypothetical protein